MKVEPSKVVVFHYTVREDGGESGERFDVTVEPADAYGERREDFTQRVPKKYFQDADSLKPGMMTVLSVSGGGQRQVTVQKIGSSVIDVDLNHPLAGKTLVFDVDIVDVRDATPEEVEHKHAHG